MGWHASSEQHLIMYSTNYGENVILCPVVFGLRSAAAARSLAFFYHSHILLLVIIACVVVDGFPYILPNGRTAISDG